MFKLVRDTNCVNVVDQEGQIIGHVSHDDLEKCGGKPNVRGFVRRARVLWVNFKNPDQVKYFHWPEFSLKLRFFVNFYSMRPVRMYE